MNALSFRSDSIERSYPIAARGPSFFANQVIRQVALPADEGIQRARKAVDVVETKMRGHQQPTESVTDLRAWHVIGGD
jgi:hypothetical protein